MIIGYHIRSWYVVTQGVGLGVRTSSTVSCVADPIIPKHAFFARLKIDVNCKSYLRGCSKEVVGRK